MRRRRIPWPQNEMPTRSRFPRARTALLLVDVVNPFDFPGGRAFARKSLRVVRAIAALRQRATRARLPVIYVNDNLGKWRSNAHALVAMCSQPGMPGAIIVPLLKPNRSDYVILKATLSGFYQTPLEMMLRLGRVSTLIVAGFAADNCVLFTAADAYMREFRLVIPRDCIAAQTDEGLRHAVQTMKRQFDARIVASRSLRLSHYR
jgi:nicotinamidase-related amidase